MLHIALRFVLVTALLASVSVPAMAKYDSLKPGLWEISTSTQMLGMPVDIPPVPYSTQQCITQEMLDKQENLSAISAAQGSCSVENADVTGNKTTWSMTCMNNGMLVKAHGAITPLSLEAYSGNVKFTMESQNVPPMEGKVRLQGRWLSECPPGSSTPVPTFNTSAQSDETASVAHSIQ